MLAAGGQLNRKAGGPSFHARANPEALEGLSRKSAAWKVSSQNERNRRSVYMFTQRSLTLPLMSTFDFCDTTQPCGKRDTTTVAPQALALLNNQFVHEQSEALANRITKQAGHGQTDQATLAWRFMLGRSPSSGELKLSIEHLRKQVKHFTDNASQAKPASQLALTSLCHVLFNSNEFLYVD